LFLLYWHRDAQRWARHGLTALAASYWLLATPGFSAMLAGGLDPGYTPMAGRSEATDVQAVVVLGGGSLTTANDSGAVHSLSEDSALRVLEAARLYRLLGDPVVIASGGNQGGGLDFTESQAMADVLVDLGVPADRIVQDPDSASTHEQAVNMRRLLAQHGVQGFVLVTSPAHMTRALGAFRKAGLAPVPAPASAPAGVELGPIRRWVPSEDGLDRSRSAIREYLALLYYWARGWLEIG
jgi:uncharacterized SAM-binding protein YcdF (DUF218 family)